MINYQVKLYDPIRHKLIRVYDNVIGDFVLPENTSIRGIILQDGTRIEIPSACGILEFSKDREACIRAGMAKEKGEVK